ncbi:MAG: transposase, partial [Planctomycetota bacterium]
MIAYMLTWTTYGTWLQGDERGYCKDGKTFGANPRLYQSNHNSLKHKPVYLSDGQRDVAKEGIYQEAKRIGQSVYALTVQYNHVHLILEKTKDTIESTAHRYKRTATYVLRKMGFRGNVWTKRYDARYCFNACELNTRIEYVLSHDLE